MIYIGHIYMYIYINIFNLYLYKYIYILYIYMYICIFIYVYKYVYKYVYLWLYRYTWVFNWKKLHFLHWIVLISLLTLSVQIYFWALMSIVVIYMSSFMTISHCLDYWRFVVSFEIGSYKSFCFVLPIHNVSYYM